MSSFNYERLSAQDMSFLLAEGNSTPMHVGAIGKVQMVRRTPFIVQFCWTQTPPTGRQLIAQQRADAANAAAAAAAADGKTAQVTTNKPPAGE